MNAYAHDYPDDPGHRGVSTSIEAANSIAKATGRIQRMVYHAIGEVGPRGLTCEELSARLGMERTTVQPRTSELKLLGLIRDSGQRRPNRNGKRAIVWVSVSNLPIDQNMRNVVGRPGNPGSDIGHQNGDDSTRYEGNLHAHNSLPLAPRFAKTLDPLTSSRGAK